MKGKKKLVNRVLAALCFTMALVLLLSGLGATLAKYVRTANKDSAIQAAPFFFVSDKLAENTPFVLLDPTVIGEDGKVKIAFTLSNYKDGFGDTEMDITYSYHAENEDGATIGTEMLGTLEAGQIMKEEEISLERSAFGADGNGTVTVIAKSTFPYIKTLSAQFGFNTPQGVLQQTVREEENAVVLEITGGSGSPVTVTWPSTLLIDPQNQLLENASGNSVTFTAEPGVPYALTFLKENQQTYSKEDFTVTEG